MYTWKTFAFVHIYIYINTVNVNVYDLVSCGPPHPQHPQRLGRGTVDRDMRFNIYVYMHMLDTYISYMFIEKNPRKWFPNVVCVQFPKWKKLVSWVPTGSNCWSPHWKHRLSTNPLSTQGSLAFQWVRNGIKTCDGFSATKPVGRVQMCIYKQMFIQMQEILMYLALLRHHILWNECGLSFSHGGKADFLGCSSNVDVFEVKHGWIACGPMAKNTTKANGVEFRFENNTKGVPYCWCCIHGNTLPKN